MSQQNSWRAFSSLAQVDRDTAQAADVLADFSGDPASVEIERTTNADRNTGTAFPTKHRKLKSSMAFSHEQLATPTIVGVCASQALGYDAVSQIGVTGVHRHRITPNVARKPIPWRSMVEHDGLAQFLYKGVACNSFTISGERGGNVEFSADFLASGLKEDNAAAKPAGNAESWLTYCDVNFVKGGTFNGTAVSGGTSYAATLASFSLQVGANGVSRHHFNDPTCSVSEVVAGAFTAALEAAFEIEDQAHRADIESGAEFLIHIPMIGGIAAGAEPYAIHIIAPRCVYGTLPKSFQDGQLTEQAGFLILDDGTYDGLVIDVHNLESGSYLATS